MKQKGFTMIELLAVITLLGLLTLIITPKVLEQKQNKEKELEESNKQLLYSDASTYIYNNPANYALKEGKIYCINVQTLIDNGSTVDEEDYKDKIVKVTIDEDETMNFNLVDKCKVD
jgi:prepilin-type N-terminal cleavage/methylation domain-containing protein